MVTQKKYILLAEGAAISNNASVPFGTEAYLVNDDFKKSEFSKSYEKQIDEDSEKAAQMGGILLYCKHGGYFICAKSETLQEAL